ncbi:MAG: SEL1-like repeat protein [Erysipelotrichaceae bacterium]|nr:SEL1-like repeat protein [Erysipelotrichaceae bacterium]
MGYEEDISEKVYRASENDRDGYIQDPEEQERIIALYQRYSDQSWYASYRLGILNEDGAYLPKDPEKAYRCYRQACALLEEEKGRSLRREQMLLNAAVGRCYLQGRGTEKDLERAKRHLRKAEEDPLALFLLSDLLQQDRPEEAEICRRKAIEKNYVWYYGWREELCLFLHIGRSCLYEETEEYREKGIRALLNAEGLLQDIAGKALDESYREEYRDLQKDLLNAEDLYPEIWKRIKG